VTADELKALSEALSSLARFCLSTAKIDTLHADALGDVTKLLTTVHESVRALERRVATIEERLDDPASSRHPVFPRPVA